MKYMMNIGNSRKRVGTAVPVASLRSRAGASASGSNGTFADAAVFLDWLAATGQRAWQILPLSPTHLEPGSASVHARSPYKGYGIGLDPKYLPSWAAKIAPTSRQFAAFEKRNKDWLADHSLFCALRDRFGTDDWRRWPRDLRFRRPAALKEWSARHAVEIRRHAVEQWRLWTVFEGLRRQAKRSGIVLIGDLSFYLPVQSPLVWAHRGCFGLSVGGRMDRVSGVLGVPRSYFGLQVWGHPLYRWRGSGQRRRILEIWKLRLRQAAGIYDLLRFDHAMGFFEFGVIDPKGKARNFYRRGPGAAVFAKLVRYARSLGLQPIAEDLGDRVLGLRRTIRSLRIRGVRVFRFAYNEGIKRPDEAHLEVGSYPKNIAAYTSSHDTEPLFGYMRLLKPAEKRAMARRLGVRFTADDRRLAARFRDRVVGSPADLVIVPLQDWLLTSERINVPGTERPKGDRNWRWRMSGPVEELPKRVDGISRRGLRPPARRPF